MTTLLLAVLLCALPARAQFDDYPAKSASDAKKQGEQDPGYDIYPSFAQPAKRAHKAPETKSSSGWEFTGNPDRYPSIAFQQSGAETVNGHQDFFPAGGGNENRSTRVFTINSVLTAVLPLSDRWSLTASGGANESETNQYAIPNHPLSISDNSVAVYGAGLRYYAVGSKLRWSTEKNPDRWPSFGVVVTGGNTYQYDVTQSNNGINQPFSSRQARVDNETRVPLADWYTLLATLSWQYNESRTLEVPSLAGTSGYLRSAGLALEHRFYLVDRNLLFNDEGRNPDRWSSFYVSASGLRSYSGKSSTTAGTSRYQEQTAVGAALGMRLPMTSRATLRVEMDYGYADAKLPQQAAAAGTRTRYTQLGALTSFRYYCF